MDTVYYQKSESGVRWGRGFAPGYNSQEIKAGSVRGKLNFYVHALLEN
jgi:hypothetical protein